MYPELKHQIENLDQELSEVEQEAIEMILSSSLDLIQEKLKDSYLKIQSQLSIKLLFCKNFEDLKPKQIWIKFRSLKNLKKYINSELFEIELTEILDTIEELILEKNSQDLDEILDFCFSFSKTSGIFTSKETILGYANRIVQISAINDDINAIKKMIEQNNQRDTILDFILKNFKNNQKILERLALFLFDSGQIEISEDISSFIKKLNVEKDYIFSEEAKKKQMDLEEVFRILELIDSELVENFYLQDIPLDECHLSLMQKAQELYENFENELERKIKNYKKTAKETIPQIDGILAEFISQILDSENQKVLLKSIRNLKKNTPIISFKKVLESMTHFPLELQDIYCELLILFSENPCRALNFLFCSDFVTQSMRLVLES